MGFSNPARRKSWVSGSLHLSPNRVCVLTSDDAPVVNLDGVQASDLLKADRNSESLAKLSEIIGPEVPGLGPLTIV